MDGRNTPEEADRRLSSPSDVSEEDLLDLLTRRAEIQRVVGMGVNFRAIDRLIQLWPEAQVVVVHSRPGARYDGRPKRWTRVEVYKGEPKPPTRRVTATSYCHPGDRFTRRRGVDVAFRRALRLVKEVTEGGSP